MKLLGSFCKVFLTFVCITAHKTNAFNFRQWAEQLTDTTSCYMGIAECCNRNGVPADLDLLEKNLERNLYGQHIVQKWLLEALRAHFHTNNDSERAGQKPLVLSFQGPSGTGKNFVAENVVNTIYKAGMKSFFVRSYKGKIDFPLASEAEQYRIQLHSEITSKISRCPQSMFIFDEVDRMPAQILDALTAIVDYRASGMSDGLDYSKAVFIFLSNTAQGQITDHLTKLATEQGTLRHETKLSDFEEIMRKSSYSFEGGLKKTSLITANLIDHFMPFLPLEKEHVRMCIIAQYKHFQINPDEEAVQHILQKIVQYDTYGIYSKSGCKLALAKVKLLISGASHTEL